MSRSYEISAIPTIPEKIHFVWVGGSIPEEYLLSIRALSEIAEISDFEINLWIDDSNHYKKALANLQNKLDLTDVPIIPQLRIRDIEILKDEMKNHPFFQRENLINRFWACVNRERVGFNNLGNASDYLRYAILLLEGGYYFDTDTEFVMEAETKLIPDQPILGILANITVTWTGRNGSSDSEFVSLTQVSGSNDIIGALPNHVVLCDVIEQSIIAYEKLDADLEFAKKKSNINFQAHPATSKMDVKRFPHYNFAHNQIKSNRVQLSIEAVGPSQFVEAIKKFWFNQPNHSIEAVQSLLIEARDYSHRLAGIQVISHSDQTWLNKQKKVSFDDASIPEVLTKTKLLKK